MRYLCMLLYLLALAVRSHATYEWVPIGPDGGIVVALKAIPSAPEILICGLDNGGMFRSTDGGDTWMDVPTMPSSIRVNDMAVGSFQDLWSVYVSSGSGLYRSDDRGQTWDRIVTESVSSIEAGARGMVLAKLHRGQIWQLSYDRGQSWEEDVGLSDYVYQATLSADGAFMYTLHPGGEAWKASVDDLLWENVCDGGEIWGGPGRATDFKVHPIAPEELYAPGFSSMDIVHEGIRWAGVLRSVDGGRTWENLEGGLVTALEMARSNGDVLLGNADGHVQVWDEERSAWKGLGQFDAEIHCLDPERWGEGILTAGTSAGIYQTAADERPWTNKGSR